MLFLDGMKRGKASDASIEVRVLACQGLAAREEISLPRDKEVSPERSANNITPLSRRDSATATNGLQTREGVRGLGTIGTDSLKQFFKVFAIKGPILAELLSDRDLGGIGSVGII